jgi:cell division septation protein DedD
MPEAPPAAPAPGAATTESKELSPAMSSNREESRVASLQNPGFANLAKSGATETQKLRASAPAQVWVIQIASFAREAEARAFAAKLKEKGYNVNVLSGEVVGQPRFRVEVGPLANRSDAQAKQKELENLHKLEQTFILSRPPTPSASAQPR